MTAITTVPRGCACKRRERDGPCPALLATCCCSNRELRTAWHAAGPCSPRERRTTAYSYRCSGSSNRPQLHLVGSPLARVRRARVATWTSLLCSALAMAVGSERQRSHCGFPAVAWSSWRALEACMHGAYTVCNRPRTQPKKFFFGGLRVRCRYARHVPPSCGTWRVSQTAGLLLHRRYCPQPNTATQHRRC